MESKSRERQQFEDAWVNDNSSTPDDAKRVRGALNRIWFANESGKGAYFDSFVMLAWVWWQKSRTALVVELPSFDGYKEHVAKELQAAFKIACANNGITVKGEGDE